MNFGVLFAKATNKDFPPGHFYAHISSVGLTTHGLGIAAAELLRLWTGESYANVEPVPYSTHPVCDHRAGRRIWPHPSRRGRNSVGVRF